MLVGTTNLNTTLNLTYVLADVVETLLLDMRSEMKKQGYDLRYDAKHNFNTAIAAIRRLKQDVDKTQLSTQESVLDRDSAAGCIGDGWTVDVIAHILSFIKDKFNINVA